MIRGLELHLDLDLESNYMYKFSMTLRLGLKYHEGGTEAYHLNTFYIKICWEPIPNRLFRDFWPLDPHSKTLTLTRASA